MRCGKHEHQPGQRCPAKNAKCKECHKIGHFHKVCQSKKGATQRANLVQTPQDDDDIHIDENGVRQPNPPRVNILKVFNHIEANRASNMMSYSYCYSNRYCMPMSNQLKFIVPDLKLA